MTNKASALLFDLDGTLSDSQLIHQQAWRKTLAAHRININQQALADCCNGASNDAIISQLFSIDTTPVERLEIATLKEQHYRQLAQQQLTPIAGAIAFVNGCHALGLPLALVTNAPRQNVTLALTRFELEDVFNCIICEQPTITPKPSAEPFLKACSQLGVKAADCYAFEDSINGLLAAHRAGCRVIGIGEQARLSTFTDGWYPDFTRLHPQHFLNEKKAASLAVFNDESTVE